MKRPIQSVFKQDDDPERIDIDAVHEYLAEESYVLGSPACRV
jgi:hypothetical protein